MLTRTGQVQPNPYAWNPSQTPDASYAAIFSATIFHTGPGCQMKTGFWYRFCQHCTRKARKSLDHALKNAGGPMIERMVGTRMLDIKKSGIAGTANDDDFAKRRRL